MKTLAAVVNYRTPEDLRGFLASWDAAKPMDAELIIVNVAPTDEDRRVAKEETQSRFVHLEFDDNVGYARACNEAARLADSEVIAFFNADTRIRSGTIEMCSEVLFYNERWGILGPRQVDDDNRITHGGIFGTAERPVHRGWHEVDRGQFSDVREAVTVSGSAYFIRRETWSELERCSIFRAVAPESTGAFLPTPHYFEETWCSYHARAHGWRVMYLGTEVVVHRWHKASPVGGAADKQFEKSRALFRYACAAHTIECD